jgi:hypothetical protein
VLETEHGVESLVADHFEKSLENHQAAANQYHSKICGKKGRAMNHH